MHFTARPQSLQPIRTRFSRCKAVFLQQPQSVPKALTGNTRGRGTRCDRLKVICETLPGPSVLWIASYGEGGQEQDGGQGAEGA